MKTVLWVSFIYFSSRGALLYYNLLTGPIDAALLLILKGIFIIWFVIKLLNKKTYKLVGVNLIVVLFLLTLLSALVNKTSIEQLSRFSFNVFAPMCMYYYLAFKMNYRSCLKLFKFICIYYVAQFLFSILININMISKGNFLVDDPFFGFYGYPRAYAFSYATSLVSGALIFQFVIEKNKKNIIYIIPLFFTQVLAGAGTVIIFSLTALALTYLTYIFVSRKFSKILYGTIVTLILFPVITFYQSKMLNFRTAIDDAFGTSILQNPKIFFFIKSIHPVVSDFKKFVLGFGPGNYMSWTSKQFRLDLVRIYNDDLHETLYTDAYQAFNNIVGFWGDLGIGGLIGYYWLIISMYLYISKRGQNGYIRFATLFIVVFSILLSTFQQVFEDVYYSFIFWIVLGILTNISHKKSINNNLKNSVVLQDELTHA